VTLGELLRELGHHPLTHHPWAMNLLVTLNAVLPPAQALTEASSGFTILGALSILPIEEQRVLLQSDLNPLTGALRYVEKDGRVEHDTPVDPPAEAFHRTILHDLAADGKRAALLIIAFMIVVVAIVLVMAESSRYTEHHPDTKLGLFKRLVQYVLDFIDALTGNFQPDKDYVPH
jgi:hypothetical protein